jgi:uncharacterized protein (TIGR02466 family)
LSSKEIKPFLDYVNSIVYLYSQESHIKYDKLSNYWIQDYYPNQSHERHSHPMSTISGTYYIRANEFAGNLIFHDPNPHTNMTVFNTNNRNLALFGIKPKKGLLVLFPSWLEHESLPSPERRLYKNKFFI